MNIIQVLSDALSLFQKRLYDLSGKRTFVHLLVLSFGADFSQ